ncbi:MAG TPA: glycosyltransferase family 4 protein [bacterium]|nr:glycosyltransferase family 4 protein [bacterium]
MAMPQSKTPTVVQVLTGLDPGGIGQGVVDLAIALACEGWRSLVVSPATTEPRVGQLEGAGVQHITLPVDSKHPATVLRNHRALVELIRTERIDLVHALTRLPAWIARSATRRTGCAYVTSVHSVFRRQNRLKHLYNTSMVSGDRVIAVSQFIAEYVRTTYRIDPTRLRVVDRGADLAVFDPAQVAAAEIAALRKLWRLPEGLPVLVVPGRVGEGKGQHLVIEALGQLPTRNFRCLVVGDAQTRTEYRRSLEEQIRRWGLSEQVQLTGHRSDMPAVYALADLAICPSIKPEAFGRVVAEAMAMGCPVIASAHGAPKDIVLPGVTGWLAAPNDVPALAAAIGEALALPSAVRTGLGERGMDRARTHFSSERMCRDTMAVYRELLS